MAASDDAGPGWYRDGLEHVWLPYTQMKTARPPLPVVRTEGCRIHLADGRVLVDGIASWWTAAHGYNHPHLLKAVADQLERMPHVMFGGLVHEPALRLARRLAAITPGDLDHAFFAESGSVAVEVALKMAVQYWLNHGERRSRFVFFRHGYHGDTTGAMAVCDPEEGMHARFSHLLARHLLADLPRTDEETEAFDALLARHREDIAAIIIEPLVQGAGGMRFHDPDVLGSVARLARAHGLL
ncbi:MAG: aminotransferase class III-fold pyridoxal phosphate-dependent enzyme, partial [Alphaproteobacteria bacterium]